MDKLIIRLKAIKYKKKKFAIYLFKLSIRLNLLKNAFKTCF